jgi:hypothetical protein
MPGVSSLFCSVMVLNFHKGYQNFNLEEFFFFFVIFFIEAKRILLNLPIFKQCGGNFYMEFLFLSIKIILLRNHGNSSKKNPYMRIKKRFYLLDNNSFSFKIKKHFSCQQIEGRKQYPRL